MHYQVLAVAEVAHVAKRQPKKGVGAEERTRNTQNEGREREKVEK